MRMRAAYKPGQRRTWPFFLMIAVVAALGYFTYSYFNKEANTPYLADLQEYRSKRQRFINQDPQSPWAGKEDEMPRLRFFKANLKWRVEASLDIFPVDSFDIQRVHSMEKTYALEGVAKFPLGEKVYQLVILRCTEAPDSGHLFIPFRDATCGAETYAGGRYIDLDPNALSQNHILLDFNLAYQPFCAYDSTLVCPLSPQENTLPMEVKAGERN